jgi:hypothetical protein
MRPFAIGIGGEVDRKTIANAPTTPRTLAFE